ncbi:MAG: metallophosphoesterase [Oscillospiraceae bacterium]|jgi:2',3'-cyclic-nucleotide 2'-phosphodiesterase (5'-nucleotidase family)|nr:metallophosphoesterase [Oscillospiraceae bacterium]
MHNKKGNPRLFLKVVVCFLLVAGLLFGSTISGLAYDCDVKELGNSNYRILFTSDIHSKGHGLRRLNSYVKKMKKRGLGVVLIDAGDTFTSKSKPGNAEIIEDSMNEIIPEMNKIGYSYCVPGNHEFTLTLGADRDFSPNRHNFDKSILYDSSQRLHAKSFISNVSASKDAGQVTRDFFENDVCKSVLIRANKKGCNVGLIALTTLSSKTRYEHSSMGAVSDLDFEEIDRQDLKNKVNDLREQGADSVGLISHLRQSELDQIRGIFDWNVNGHLHRRFINNEENFIQMGSEMDSVAEFDPQTRTLRFLK